MSWPQGELMELAYPLFLVCYINMEDHAGKFFDLFRVDHENRHRTEMEDMAAAKDRSSSTKDNPVRVCYHSAQPRL